MDFYPILIEIFLEVLKCFFFLRFNHFKNLFYIFIQFSFVL